MQQPKMIVLALLGIGLRYGFEMEDFARRTNMRQWAKIGMSSIYKALKDLGQDGSVAVESEASDRGPTRKSYALTKVGRTRMIDLIKGALSSEASIYSERIAGLVFAPLLGRKTSQQIIAESLRTLERNDERLARSAEAIGMDAVGLAVIEFYRDVYAAEQAAMRKVLRAMEAEEVSS